MPFDPGYGAASKARQGGGACTVRDPGSALDSSMPCNCQQAFEGGPESCRDLFAYSTTWRRARKLRLDAGRTARSPGYPKLDAVVTAWPEAIRKVSFAMVEVARFRMLALPARDPAPC